MKIIIEYYFIGILKGKGLIGFLKQIEIYTIYIKLF